MSRASRTEADSFARWNLYDIYANVFTLRPDVLRQELSQAAHETRAGHGSVRHAVLSSSQSTYAGHSESCVLFRQRLN